MVWDYAAKTMLQSLEILSPWFLGILEDINLLMVASYPDWDLVQNTNCESSTLPSLSNLGKGVVWLTPKKDSF